MLFIAITLLKKLIIKSTFCNHNMQLKFDKISQRPLTFFHRLIADFLGASRVWLQICCKSAGSYIDLEKVSACMDLFLWPCYTFSESCNYQKHIPGYKDLLGLVTHS